MLRPLLVAALAATSTALSVKRAESATEELFTIELGPGVTQVVTEEEKWALKREGKTFIDITNHPNLASGAHAANAAKFAAVRYPSRMAQTAAVNGLIAQLSASNLETRLTTFSGFQNRYYRSTYGRQASDWLLAEIAEIVDASGASAAISLEPFSHSFTQQSIVLSIPGQGEGKVIVGAHLDSVNQQSPMNGRSPGADDDGSGSMTTLEALRVLLTDPTIASGEGLNTLEFHWYAGEAKGGLLGSSDIYDAYASDGAVVKAMLQQDMTGYDNGPMGVIGDRVDKTLTSFVKKVIDEYTTIGYVDSECGYGCSDHASATSAGYPSSFVIEAHMDDISPYIHSARDTMDTVSIDHMLQHARMVLGFAYELTMASL
ncbi:Zn-dependent exopeptidase [Xylariomycetidae sp. FL2044]|nr:Zn-dependent exopeptidase [Xylariomycetidae sp. FL2044]